MRETTFEEPTSWKGHSFTLLVFAGIVALCSIFFVLGMLVGRSQGKRIAEIALTASPADPLAAGDTATGQELTFYSAVEADEEEAEIPLEPPRATPEPELPPEPVADALTAPGSRIYLQVAALSQRKDAEKELEKLRSKGFRSALILSPSAGSKDKLFRVQVGPYDSEEHAIQARKDLDAKGFKQVFIKK